MEFDTNTGLITDIPFFASPHCNQRPDNIIDLLVIHGISLPPGEFGNTYIHDLFLGKLNAKVHGYFVDIAQRQVSAHLLIDRDGNMAQYVSFFDCAWHAGESCWQGRYRCNDFSIGIELEGADDVSYTAAQYQQLVAVTKLLMLHFPRIKKDSIVGHSDIAPQRKTDPGVAFDWQYFRSKLME